MLDAKISIIKISIIIPVLNEAQTIQDVVAIAQTASHVEIIAVDGGSRDGTQEILQSLGVKLLITTPGRAHQMNLGAEVATGKILLFLHADTHLPPGFDDWVRQTLAQPGVVAGAFKLQIDSTLRGIRWLEWWVNWRSHHRQMPYGDQAIFLTTQQFNTIGKFPELPIMEDFELIRRLQRQGRIAIVPHPVITSGRRWQKLGILKTTFINQLVVIAFLLGVSTDRLRSWYGRR
ncbi:MAG: TIGR04283 family arsenosugar biosynthesis glycosyltransferase [Leptolyngbyaceae bacterium]|nr:TIGR04283 family arsenosugar biosynthesis glycosyltransferase [Leptolyngbyaceae bacterium]